MPDKLFGVPYEDLYLRNEDARIERIGEEIKKGKLVAVLIDNEEDKIQRYIKKLKERCNAVIVSREDGPVNNVVTLRVKQNVST